MAFFSATPDAGMAMQGMEGTASVPHQGMSEAMPIGQRKRKEHDIAFDGQDAGGERDAIVEHQTGIKNIRRLANMPRSNSMSGNADEEAQFHPLPADLNMQLLANLGYLNNALMSQQQSAPGSVRTSHSPTSSFSDFGGPATPLDNTGSAESYFTKGMRRDSSALANYSHGAAYPDFKIYPDEQQSRVHTPGLLGMNMQAQTAPADGMQMDGDNAAPSHGPQCKSIPKLHLRVEEGISSELWAQCPDCGSLSKIDAPPISDALSYSP